MLGSVSSASAGTAQVWSGASMKSYSQAGASQFFNSIDTTGSGTITKAQFEQSLKTSKLPQYAQGVSTSDLWSKLDLKGTGSVTKQDFLSGLKSVRNANHKKHTDNDLDSQKQTVNDSLNELNSLVKKSKTSSQSVNVVI